MQSGISGLKAISPRRFRMKHYARSMDLIALEKPTDNEPETFPVVNCARNLIIGNKSILAITINCKYHC